MVDFYGELVAEYTVRLIVWDTNMIDVFLISHFFPKCHEVILFKVKLCQL